MSQIKVNFIGAGRVGKTLLGLLRALPTVQVQDVMSSRLLSAQEAVQLVGSGTATENYDELREADLWILSVPDAQISLVSSQLSETYGKHQITGSTPVAIHCSGFFTANEMDPLRKLGWHLASVHPVLSFSDPETAMQQFEGTYCGVEGDTEALNVVVPLFHKIGAQTFEMRSENKSLYHAAAVFSNNFAVVLQAFSQEAWDAAGVPKEVSLELNRKLLQSTYENVIAYGPRDALTGPAARGDQLVIAKQGEDVARWHPEAGNIYNQMSVLAQRLKTIGSTQKR